MFFLSFRIARCSHVEAWRREPGVLSSLYSSARSCIAQPESSSLIAFLINRTRFSYSIVVSDAAERSESTRAETSLRRRQTPCRPERSPPSCKPMTAFDLLLHVASDVEKPLKTR